MLGREIDGHVTSDYIVIDDIPEGRVENYVHFLVGGEDFTMTPADEYIFGLFGHPNTYGYPLGYWRVKLRHMWIRHFMKAISLLLSPSNDDMAIVNKSIPVVRMPGNCGYGDGNMIYTSPLGALYAMGLNVQNDGLGYTNNDYKSWYSLIYTNSITGVETPSSIHVIPSSSHSHHIDPIDFIYSQDVDVMQVTLVMEDDRTPVIYATDLAIYALENKTTYLDPTMSVSSLPVYAEAAKTFVPWIPYTTTQNILPIPFPPYIYSLMNVLDDRDIVAMVIRENERNNKNNKKGKDCHHIISLLPKDIGSIILMIGYYGLHSYTLVDDMVSAYTTTASSTMTTTATSTTTTTMEPFLPILEASPLYSKVEE